MAISRRSLKSRWRRFDETSWYVTLASPIYLTWLTTSVGCPVTLSLRLRGFPAPCIPELIETVEPSRRCSRKLRELGFMAEGLRSSIRDL